MIGRFVSAVLVLAPLAFVACTVEKAPPNTSSTPPATPAATGTVATMTNVCPPVGLWRATGPTGPTEIKIASSSAKPGSYDVSYKGANVAGGGTQDGDKFNVDLGASTGGMYNCTMASDCHTMSCGFTGQAPTVFNKTE